MSEKPDFFDRNKIEVYGALRDLKKWQPGPIAISNRITDKPLRWRSGYLPDDFSGEVIIEMYDGTHRIYDLGERERFGMKRMAYKWLPLSEILDLIGE